MDLVTVVVSSALVSGVVGGLVTAALDAETEHALFERYTAAVRGGRVADSDRIRILVSHRFSTVRSADLIVVLDGATVVEVGPHAELAGLPVAGPPSSTTFRPRTADRPAGFRPACQRDTSRARRGAA